MPPYKLPTAYKASRALHLSSCISLWGSLRLSWLGLGSLKHLQEAGRLAWAGCCRVSWLGDLVSWSPNSICCSHSSNNPLPACSHGGEKSAKEKVETRKCFPNFCLVRKIHSPKLDLVWEENIKWNGRWGAWTNGPFLQWIYRNTDVSMWISVCIYIYLIIGIYVI